MIAMHIELILIVTGVATATMLIQFFAPLPVLRLIYGEAPTDGVTVALARHWGLLIFCVGVLLIYAAFSPRPVPPSWSSPWLRKSVSGFACWAHCCAGRAFEPGLPWMLCSRPSY